MKGTSPQSGNENPIILKSVDFYIFDRGQKMCRFVGFVACLFYLTTWVNSGLAPASLPTVT